MSCSETFDTQGDHCRCERGKRPRDEGTNRRESRFMAPAEWKKQNMHLRHLQDKRTKGKRETRLTLLEGILTSDNLKKFVCSHPTIWITWLSEDGAVDLIAPAPLGFRSWAMIGLVADVGKITRQPERKNFHKIRLVSRGPMLWPWRGGHGGTPTVWGKQANTGC